MMTSQSNIRTEVWASVWTLAQLISLLLPCYRCNFFSHGQCAGQSLTVSCGSPDFMLHVLYELYTYDPTDDISKCDTDSHQCSNAEFLDPISVGHCNGNSQCTFQVPSNKYIPSCDKNNTAMKVVYACIPRPQVFDICSNFIHTNLEKLYLATPEFPSNTFKQNRCFCSLTGQNIKGTVLQHEKLLTSRVIMIFSTDKGTMHINGVNVLNTGLFDGVQKLNLNIYNDQLSEVFKLWLEITGKNMILKCGTEPPAWSSGSSRPIKATPALSSSLYLMSSDRTESTSQEQSSSLQPGTSGNPRSETDISPSKTSSHLQTVVDVTSHLQTITDGNSLLVMSRFSTLDSSTSSSIHTSYSIGNIMSSSTSSTTCEIGTLSQSCNTVTSSDTMEQISTSSTTLSTYSKDFQSISSSIENSFNSYLTSSPMTRALLSNSQETVGTSSSSMTVKLQPSSTASSDVRGEVTPSYFIASSSVIPQDQNNSVDSTQTDENSSDLTLIIVLSSLACLLFLCLIAAVLFFFWRWVKNKPYRMQNDEIYDAYEDNPAIEPDPEPVVVNGPRPLQAGLPNRNVLPIFLLNVMWYMLQ